MASLCKRCKKRYRAVGKKWCHKCLQQSRVENKKRQELRKKKRVCVNCGSKDVLPIRSHGRRKNYICEKCFFRRAALKAGDVRIINKIRDLFYKQKAICAYTGKKLYLGFNASLDHRKPKILGGSNSIKNLQWVDVDINAMKWGMSEKVFLDTMVKTLTHKGYKVEKRNNGKNKGSTS